MAESNPFCINCGAELRPVADFCGKCGIKVKQGNPNPQPAYNYSQGNVPYGKPSAAWWLLPIFISLIGGAIAWACLRDRDPRMANKCLVLGIILTVVPFAAGFVITGIVSLPYMFGY